MPHPAFRLIAAAAIVIVAAVPAAAQTNSFEVGFPVNSSPIALGSATGATMSGLQVVWAFDGGGDGLGNWGDLGGGLCGVAFGGLSVTVGCDADTFSANWTVSNFSGGSLASLRFRGGLFAHTFFDCGFTAGSCDNSGTGNALGSNASGLGVSLGTVVGGSYTGEITGVYSNVVGIDGNAPVGDLFEQLTIEFDDLLGPQQTYVFNADTDNSLSEVPPPTEVPEPSTFALMFAGIVGIGGLSRQRRRDMW